MLESGNFSRVRGQLIEKIYATVADPSLWSSLIGELVSVTHSRSARLLILNQAATRVLSSIKHNIDDDYHRQYVDYYVNACPWRPELRRKRPGRLYSTYLHFSCRQPDYLRSEFFNDWAGPQDIHHGVCGTIFQDGTQTVQLLVQRTRGQGHFTATDTGFFNHLVPHLQQAFQLAGHFARNRARTRAIEIAAGEEILPFVLLDSSLRPVYCNPSAEALIKQGSTMVVTAKQLRLTNREHDRVLQRILGKCLHAAASRTFHTTGETLEVPRPLNASLYLRVKPVHPDIPLWEGRTGYVAIYMYDSRAHPAIDCERLGRIYNLSRAEIRVAMALLDTPEPAEVAKHCAISLHTVRSHLKAIFSKTGARNQAELVKLLLSGPARRR